jgi:hypothetical protein
VSQNNKFRQAGVIVSKNTITLQQKIKKQINMRRRFYDEFDEPDIEDFDDFNPLWDNPYTEDPDCENAPYACKRCNNVGCGAHEIN